MPGRDPSVVALRCEFDLDESDLHSVLWSKGDKGLFSYIVGDGHFAGAEYDGVDGLVEKWEPGSQDIQVYSNYIITLKLTTCQESVDFSCEIRNKALQTVMKHLTLDIPGLSTCKLITASLLGILFLIANIIQAYTCYIFDPLGTLYSQTNNFVNEFNLVGVGWV